MKANEAPEKIFLQVCGDCSQTDCENCKFEDMEDDITWCKDRIFPKDIEYTRTDAFIEKAIRYLNSKLYDWVQTTNPNQRSYMNTIIKQEFIEGFKNAMKGEQYD